MDSKTPIRRKYVAEAPIFRGMAPMFSLRKDLNQLFDGLFTDWLDVAPTNANKGIQTWGNFSPNLNLEEKENELIVKLEIPGMTDTDLDISLLDGMLLIKGEKKEDFDKSEGKLHFVGRSYGSFEQRIPLSVEVNEDAVEASAENGILTIRLPKAEVSKERVRKISVKSK